MTSEAEAMLAAKMVLITGLYIEGISCLLTRGRTIKDKGRSRTVKCQSAFHNNVDRYRLNSGEIKI